MQDTDSVDLQCCLDGSDSEFHNGIGKWVKKKAQGVGKGIKKVGKGIKKVATSGAVKTVADTVADNIRAGAEDGAITSETLSQQENTPAKKSKTGLYIGIGVGVLAVIGVIVFIVKRKKK